MGVTPGRFDWHPEPALVDLTDPEARRALTAFGQETWRLALDYLEGEALRRPVGPENYAELRNVLFGPTGRPAPPPEHPMSTDGVLQEVRDRIVPHLFNSQHPRAFSYFTPPPLVTSIGGELLSQWFHQGVDVFHAGPAAALIEEEVVGWLRTLVGFDETGWGVLTSGGVMANIMGVLLARDRHLASILGVPARGRALERARVYVSDQAHFSVARALDVLGFPAEALVVIESDDRFSLRPEPVARRIAADRAAGYLPFCVAAVTGSTNTGSVDDVVGLSVVCRRENCWLHVDAAYGGAARLSRRDASRVPGLELADSVTIDPHKWFFQAYDIGALVVRRKEDLHSTFFRDPEYYRSTLPETEPLNWLEYSIEGTRRFRALKLWMSWKHLGTEGLGRLIEHNNDLAEEFAAAIQKSDDFEAVPEEPELSVVCFRHLGASDQQLDGHQDRLQLALEASGRGWVSTTRLRGQTYLRAGVMNYMSTTEDVLSLLDTLRSLSAHLPA